MEEEDRDHRSEESLGSLSVSLGEMIGVRRKKSPSQALSMINRLADVGSDLWLHLVLSAPAGPQGAQGHSKPYPQVIPTTDFTDSYTDFTKICVQVASVTLLLS